MKGRERRGPKEEQSRATQERLLGAARALFSERGFAGTATEDLVARAGMTRGALYHQYVDKRDLFRAVFEDVERQLNTVSSRVSSALRQDAGHVEQSLNALALSVSAGLKQNADESERTLLTVSTRITGTLKQVVFDIVPLATADDELAAHLAAIQGKVVSGINA